MTAFFDMFLEFVDYIREYSTLSAIIRMLLAVILGAIVGFERERHGRAAGLRTHILVCLGATIATLIGHYNISVLNIASDPMRIGAQVLSGIGFLGVGTILSKGRFQVTGLTTAAGLWTTAAIGLATGIGFYEGALLSTILVVLTMTTLAMFDSQIIKKNKKIRIYIEIDNINNINPLINRLRSEYSATGIQVTVPRSGIAGNSGIEATIRQLDGVTFYGMIELVNGFDEVTYALPSI